MNAKITGIIIDQTRSKGKWYVREIPDKNGDGVQPLFFRREKNDLFGKLIDKIKGAQSAQRYAAAHVNELNIPHQISAAEITEQTLKQKPTYNTHKWESALVEQFLTDRVGNLTAQSGVMTTSVIDNSKQHVNKRQIEKFWQLYDQSKSNQSDEKITKKEFTRLMKQSVDLMSKSLITNDASVHGECEKFIRNLCDADDPSFEWSLGSSEPAQDLFTNLKEFFIAEATPVGKNTQLMKELLVDNSIKNDGEKIHQAENLLKTAFQIYYADQTSDDKDSPKPLPWKPVTIPKNTEDLAAISRGLTSLHFPPTTEYDALKQALHFAIDRRRWPSPG